MSLKKSLCLILTAVLNGGKDHETVSQIRQSSQVKASAARFAETPMDVKAFSDAAKYIAEMR